MTIGTSGLHERDIYFKETIAFLFVVDENVGKSLISVEGLRAMAELKSAPQKTTF